MTLHLITLVVNFNNYKWANTLINVIEKDKVYVVTEDNPENIMSLVPDTILKNNVNVILASQNLGYRQLSLSIYCKGQDISECKDKLITEIAKLSEAYRQGFENQKMILDSISHDNK